MIKLQNITNEADQEHKLEFLSDTVTFSLRFFEGLQDWFICINYKGVDVKGIRCAVGVRLLKSNNFPFDIYLVDNAANGQDPFRQDDFIERISIYILEHDDLENIRGYKVQVDG